MKIEPRYFVIYHSFKRRMFKDDEIFTKDNVREFKYKSQMDGFCEHHGYTFRLRLDEDGLSIIEEKGE